MVRHPLSRHALIALGWVCVGLGVAGALLPVVPGTPFFLLALWLFARSSPRFHAWLWNHRLFGPPLRRWHADRSLSVRTKAVVLASMAAGVACLLLVVRPPAWIAAASGTLVAVGALLVLRVRTRRGPPPAV